MIANKSIVAVVCVIVLVISVVYFYRRMTSDKVEIKLTAVNIIEDIPSASGIIIHNASALVIGDDATGLYEVDLATYQHRKIPFNGANHELYREPKSVKHDFESSAKITWNDQTYLLAFGSGSIKTLRDSLIIINLNDLSKQKLVSLRSFYDSLQSLTKTDPQEMNIEGATVSGDDLFLCNRANNMLTRVNVAAFMNYILNNDECPEISYHTIELPSINGKQARLSGLCTLNETSILFCASVEDAPNWISDGPVLGSFIGQYSIKKNKVEFAHQLVDKNGNALIEKIESLEVISSSKGIYEIIAVADNDNGSSKFFRLELSEKR